MMKQTAIPISMLPHIHKQPKVCIIGNDDLSKLAVIADNQNSTGKNILPLFSTFFKAQSYRDRYKSLREYKVLRIETEKLISILDGKIDLFVLDRE
jgi:hypothetical protein